MMQIVDQHKQENIPLPAIAIGKGVTYSSANYFNEPKPVPETERLNHYNSPDKGILRRSTDAVG